MLILQMRLKSELFDTNDVCVADDDHVHKDRKFQLYIKKGNFFNYAYSFTKLQVEPMMMMKPYLEKGHNLYMNT